MILDYYWHIFPHTIVGFLAVCLLIALVNYFSIRRFDDYPTAQDFPKVSILIPARNEEANIRSCVESLLAQNYPDFEILVLDDNSTDQTGAILEQMSQWNPYLKVYSGEPLPAGWLGKHWACHQLTKNATGDFLLFTDADTRYRSNALRDGISALIAEKADLVTAFPYEEMLTWGERLTVPILGFSIFCFFPILLAEKIRLPAFSVTVGQFMLFRRTAFDSIGGYESIRDHPVDDMMLGRCIVAHGFCWKFMDATRHITCRMYRGFSDASDGFTKNIFSVFNHHILLYTIGWIWIAVSFIVPIYALITAMISPLRFFPVSIAMVAVCEALLMTWLAYRRLHIPIRLVLIYPISLLIFTWIAFRSLLYSISGHGTWKGRNIVRPMIKL